MRWTFAALLGSALVAHPSMAALTYTVEATHNGVPVPQSEIKIEPFEFGGARTRQGTHSQSRQRNRRSNPTDTSGNWCGSVNHVPSGHQIQTIHGTYQHPSCTLRSGMGFPQLAASWVGIDGDTATNALLQAGTLCKIEDSTGTVTHMAWWEWAPESAHYITSMPVSPDDWIEITIQATSNTEAYITLSNLSQRQTYTVHIGVGPALARVEADWLVEWPLNGGKQVAGFPTFSDVWFEEAYANLTGSASLGILGAKQYRIPNLCESQEWDNTQEGSWSL